MSRDRGKSPELCFITDPPTRSENLKAVPPLHLKQAILCGWIRKRHKQQSSQKKVTSKPRPQTCSAGMQAFKCNATQAGFGPPVGSGFPLKPPVAVIEACLNLIPKRSASISKNHCRSPCHGTPADTDCSSSFQVPGGAELTSEVLHMRPESMHKHKHLQAEGAARPHCCPSPFLMLACNSGCAV